MILKRCISEAIFIHKCLQKRPALVDTVEHYCALVLSARNINTAFLY